MGKFADGPEIEVVTEIACPVENVWHLVADINLPAQFQAEFRRAEWTDEPGLGARFTGWNERKGHEWDTTSWISAYEPMRKFGWSVSDPETPGSTWTYTLSPTETGTELRFHRLLGPGPSGLTGAIERSPEREEEIIALRDAEQLANMQAVVDGIKALAEGASAPLADGAV